jgi:hypothetical protein
VEHSAIRINENCVLPAPLLQLFCVSSMTVLCEMIKQMQRALAARPLDTSPNQYLYIFLKVPDLLEYLQSLLQQKTVGETLVAFAG